MATQDMNDLLVRHRQALHQHVLFLQQFKAAQPEAEAAVLAKCLRDTQAMTQHCIDLSPVSQPAPLKRPSEEPERSAKRQQPETIEISSDSVNTEMTDEEDEDDEPDDPYAEYPLAPRYDGPAYDTGVVLGGEKLLSNKIRPIALAMIHDQSDYYNTRTMNAQIRDVRLQYEVNDRAREARMQAREERKERRRLRDNDKQQRPKRAKRQIPPQGEIGVTFNDINEQHAAFERKVQQRLAARAAAEATMRDNLCQIYSKKRRVEDPDASAQKRLRTS